MCTTYKNCICKCKTILDVKYNFIKQRGRKPKIFNFIKIGALGELSKEASKMSVKACTSSDKGWKNIDFKTAKANVKKLQMRIAKAHKAGACGKVESLQHTLIHSFYAKAIAVKTVVSNKGKSTSGIDNTIWKTDEDKFHAISTLRRRGYKPRPLRRVYISKHDGRKRPLSVPTMRDRTMQTLYKFALEPIAEVTADPNSYGFRNGKSTQDAIQRCIEVLSEYQAHVWILEGDIKSCFDNIYHDWIMEHIPIDKEVLRKFLKSGFIEYEKFNPTKRGIAQGGCISTIICNMTLDELEKQIKTTCHEDVHFIRYADDFIVISESKDSLQQEAIPIIKSFLAERGLSLSAEKTKITHIDNGFDFLGWNVRRRDNKQVLVEPSKKNLTAILNKIHDVIKRDFPTTREQRYTILKPIIVGWRNYHKGVVTTSSLNQAENDILFLIGELTKDSGLVELIGELFGET